MKEQKTIQLTVAYHPSGRHTLMESVNGERNKDLAPPLFGNMDEGSFYRAAAHLIAKHAAAGHAVTFIDK